MRGLIQRAATEDLNELTRIMLESESITDTQTELLSSIFDELSVRGEVPNIPEDEIAAQLKTTHLQFMESQVAAPEMSARENKPEWWGELNTDIQKDQERTLTRLKMIRNVAFTSVSSVLTLLILNFSFLAAGYDFFGSVAQWSKNAVSVMLGTRDPDVPPKGLTGEYDSLITTLDGLGIQVDLPTHIPGGFTFGTIEPDEPHSLTNIVAWYNDGDSYFSISVNRIARMGTERFKDAGGEEDSEVYPKENGKFMISTSKDRVLAIWHQDIYEILIQGNITYEQLTQILDSV